MQSRRRRSAVFAIIGASAALGVGAFGASAANAHSSSGCTGVSDGMTCFYVYGDSGTTWVDKFVQSRDRATPAICNYYARFRVWDRYGAKYFDANTSEHVGCFYSYRATRTLWVSRYFRNPSHACGTWYENGSALGTACESVYGQSSAVDGVADTAYDTPGATALDAGFTGPNAGVDAVDTIGGIG